MWWGGCSVVWHLTASASSLASVEHVETMFMKEGLEWRRGGVQCVWTEWLAGGFDVVWAETRRNPGSRRRVVAMSMRVRPERKKKEAEGPLLPL